MYRSNPIGTEKFGGAVAVYGLLPRSLLDRPNYSWCALTAPACRLPHRYPIC